MVESAKGFVDEERVVSFARTFFAKSSLYEQKTIGFIKEEKTVSFLMPFINRSFSREDADG